MATKLLVIGKGDNVITMILDNLYSNKLVPEITVFNNLGLPMNNTFYHDCFKICISNEIDIEDYDIYVLGVYQPQIKIKLVDEYKLHLKKNKFTSIIHSGFDMSHTSRLGSGILINSKVSIAAHTKIGDFVSINRHVSIGHHTNIGNYCSINPGVNIAGNVNIGEGTTIGMGTNILNGINIGKNVVIGAGSLVTKDLPDNVVAYGSPCKIIREN